ncbi:SLATT domain-containing protein [Oleidesulfovibrio alaskensis]|uniref:SLATT domain-containing protein n=1 Tax=Oleidesulfovibrio alaskensis TaxID=58180 RepID=UPI001B7F80B6|nr:SLATT domain-containing protein [Oleidesulfovibrio alaskensis]
MMNRDELLKSIAELGYNVGFGAKKHFATYDIVEKVPGIIGFFSMAFGIFALVFDVLSTKVLSASFLVLGLVSIYIAMYQQEKEAYREKGEALTCMFYELRDLYALVKSGTSSDVEAQYDELRRIRKEYLGCCIAKQVCFSDWYAHYKFFWQHQIEWIDEQKKFNLLRDKIPFTFYIFLLFIFIFALLFFWKVEVILIWHLR